MVDTLVESSFLRRSRGPKPLDHFKSYEYYRDFVKNAIETDAPASRDLIIANKRLAVWEGYLGVGNVLSFPRELFMAITDVCNARCLFCSYAPETSTGRLIKLSDIQKIGSWLKFVEIFRPNSALGEPLAHPQILAILEEVRKQAPFISMGITTNGALLNDDIIAAVVGHMRLMVVSLNAARKETYEKEMSPLKWEKTIGNLRRLHEHKIKLQTNRPKMIASFVVHAQNLDELAEMPAVLESVGFEGMRVNIMMVPKPIESRKLYTQADSIYHDPDKANRIFAKTREECDKRNIVLSPSVLTL